MDDLMEVVSKVWPMRFTGTGNIRFAWRADKLHSIACYGNSLSEQGVTVNSADWRDMRDACDLFHIPGAVYAPDGTDPDSVIFATWPVQTVMKYELTPDPAGALVMIPRMEFKKVEGKKQ